MSERTIRLDLAAVRARLADKRGAEYWRSLEELADADGFEEMVRHEFPRHADSWLDPVGRRQFLQLMGASLALAGLTACNPNPAATDEKIVPYVRPPEAEVPGIPMYFATAMPLAGFGLGILAESHEGRPTKIEGNPAHPASLGSTDVFAQASVLTLYDPDRSQVVTRAGRINTWDQCTQTLKGALELQRVKQGAGFRILTGTITSPTLADQIAQLLKGLPQAKWHVYEPSGLGAAAAAAQQALGQAVDTRLNLRDADVIVSLDADILGSGPAWVRYAREFIDGRRIQQGRTQMNRLYVAECTMSITGSMADHRIAAKPSDLETVARALTPAVGVGAAGNVPQLPPAAGKWVSAVAKDLQQHRGRSLVVAGEQQPAHVHALAHAINTALGNVGKTVIYTDPVAANPVDQIGSLRELVADMDAGRVEFLLILGGNPAYTAPVDLDFAQRMGKVALRVQHSLYEDETSVLCHWHIPATHYLEQWGDVRAFDGTATICQPLIAPLYNGRSAHELLAVLLDQTDTPYDLVRAYWRKQHAGGDFEQFWQKALHDGVVPNTAFPAKAISNSPRLNAGSPPAQSGTPGPGTLEIVFRSDPSIFDGRFANNGWLQELPKPFTKLTWDNAALMSPATAQRLGLSQTVSMNSGGEHGRVYADVVELKYRGRTVRAPAWIVPGHPDDTVTVHLGYGRTRAGRVGNGAGFSGYVLQTSDAPGGGPGLTVTKTGDRHLLACTQFHQQMENRHLLRAGTLAEYRKNPRFVHEVVEEKPLSHTIYPPYPYPNSAWGMAIDMQACIGCNACVVACQAENNIPVVGKVEVTRGRAMHWLRIDRYYKGEAANPEVYHQPIPCMHCENAPCELVCPVGATNHSAEGLNDQVYNRCVGTRYCSNNCPYKVRRFNFLQYADYETPSLKLLNNPNVTVRSRGVMEKCTYCVQRINAGRIRSEKEGREVRDGEIQPACQQACPTQAIVFGNINDPNSRVAKLKAEPQNYAMLDSELNTRPRTTYLARLRNPNPELEQA